MQRRKRSILSFGWSIRAHHSLNYFRSKNLWMEDSLAFFCSPTIPFGVRMIFSFNILHLLSPSLLCTGNNILFIKRCSLFTPQPGNPFDVYISFGWWAHTQTQSPKLLLALIAASILLLYVPLRSNTNKLPKFIFGFFFLVCPFCALVFHHPFGWPTKESGPLYHSSCHGNSKSSCCGSPNLL